MRFFATSSALYESIRGGLDITWGHPKIEDGVATETCIEPAETAPKGEDGRIFIALRGREESLPEVSPLLDGLLESGQIQEVTREEYLAALPQLFS